MAWPVDEVLDIKVEAGGLVSGFTWTNITEYVYKESIKITRGTPDESDQATPSTVSFLLNDADGRFSPRNPNGPYYGNFRRNTPLLVSVMGGDRYLDIPESGSAEVADSAQTSIAGDIDIRVDATLYNWNLRDPDFDGDADFMPLMSKYDTLGNQRSWVLAVRTGFLFFRWSSDGSATTTISSTDRITTASNDRLAVRVTHDVDDGSGNNVLTFYTAPTIDSDEWIQLGDPVVTSGTTSHFDSTTTLKVGDNVNSTDFNINQPNGKFWAAEVYDGINGTLAAGIDFRTQTVGDTSVVDSAGSTWTMAASGAGSINNQQNRFRGEVVAWPSRWETGGLDVWVPIQAKGLLRRHNQGNRPLKSAMTRTIPGDSDLLAYWPMEDGENSTQFAPGIPNVEPMTFSGEVTLAGHAGPEGSDDLPSMGEGADWRGVVPGPISAADAYQVEWLVNLNQVTTTLRTIFRFNTTGTIRTWQFLVDQDTVHVRGLDEDGNLDVDQGIAVDVLNDFINQWWRWQFRVTQDGANIDWTITFWQVGASGGTFSSTVAGNVGRVSVVRGAGGLHADVSGMSIGHVGVFNTGSTDVFDLADDGFAGETAAERFERLCLEQGESFITSGTFDREFGGTPMGAQRPDRFVDLMSEAAFANRGILVDTRDVAQFTGFKFVTRAALYNQPPTLTLDYGGSDGLVTPLEPFDDDLYLRNAVTVERERGSSASVELTEGALTPALVGLYDTSITVNVNTDGQLIHRAGWELHLGTWDEERYPTVRIKLQAAPHLIADVLALDVGSRIRIKNARTAGSSDNEWIPPGDIDLLVRGYREEMSQYQWEFEFQCVPARPWDVPLLDSGSWKHSSRSGQVSSELAEALDTTETAVDVITTSGPTWTDTVENMPFDWVVGGERMQVLAPGSLVTSNSLFESDVTGWSAQNASVAHSTAVVHPDRRAVGSILVTPTAAGSANALGANTGAGTINPGGRYKASAWIYSPGGYHDIKILINWHDSGGTYISTSSGSANVIPAGVWTYIEETVTAPSTASGAVILVSEQDTPAAGDIYYAWAVQVSRVKADAVLDEFGRTSTDTWGAADTLQSWTNSGGVAADYDVLSGYGRHINQATSTGHHSVITSPHADFDIYCDLTTAALSTGASQFAGIIARYTDADNLYEARVEFTTGNAITLSVRDRVAGAEAQLGTFSTSITHVAGTMVRVRFQGTGSSLKAKIWRTTSPEPSRWQVEVTDSDLSAAGSIGVKSVRNAGNTNANAEFRFDNFELVNPQTLSVDRSSDGVVKSHSAADAVTLYHPTVTAL